MLPSVRPHEALRRPRGRRGAGHIVAPPPPTACSISNLNIQSTPTLKWPFGAISPRHLLCNFYAPPRGHKAMMLSGVCLSDVCRVHPVGGRRMRPAGWIVRIGWSDPARSAWLKAAAARFRCRPGRGHIVAAVRLQLVILFTVLVYFIFHVPVFVFMYLCIYVHILCLLLCCRFGVIKEW